MAALIIGATEREKIAEIVSHAKAHPLLLSTVRELAIDGNKPLVKLEDRKPGFCPQSQFIVFPGGFRAHFSVEQQPPGFCYHLSVGVEGRSKKGAMPHPDAIKMICEEFGVPFPAEKMWIEEFEPGEFAINLVSLYQPTPQGSA
jgi:hypothetical protein